MLGTHVRQTYLDALKPPLGYKLTHAVGTTYSLNLLAMLATPMAFALFEAQDQDGEVDIGKQPIALLQALKRHSEHVDVFCDGAELKAPTSSNPLFGLLEGMVHPVRCPNADGLFHPKIWVLRFENKDYREIVLADESTEEIPGVLYRFVCLSRNLTFDQSWDTILTLEGVRTGYNSRTLPESKPLGDFLLKLPDLALRPISKERRGRIEFLAHEIMRVKFTPPEHVDEFAFYPFGVGLKQAKPFKEEFTNGLVVSPFLDKTQLTNIKTNCESRFTLISRQDQLDGLPQEAIDGLQSIYTLDDAPLATGEDDIERDLHAKIYILERKDGRTEVASLIVGSLNATSAAVDRNVEFAVELVGRRKHLGISTFLGEPGGKAVGFGALLKAYVRAPVNESEAKRMELERRLAKWKTWLASQKWTLTCSPALQGTKTFQMALRMVGSPEDSPLGAPPALQVWPISWNDEQALSGTTLLENGEVLFLSMPISGLTGFIGVKVSLEGKDLQVSSDMILSIAVDGLPESRDQAIIRSIIENESAFLKYLRFLLADEDTARKLSRESLEKLTAGGGPGDPAGSGIFEQPIFEEFIRALARDPDKIDQVQVFIEDLRESEGGDRLIPEKFQKLWAQIWMARQELLPKLEKAS